MTTQTLVIDPDVTTVDLETLLTHREWLLNDAYDSMYTARMSLDHRTDLDPMITRAYRRFLEEVERVLRGIGLADTLAPAKDIAHLSHLISVVTRISEAR